MSKQISAMQERVKKVEGLVSSAAAQTVDKAIKSFRDSTALAQSTTSSSTSFPTTAARPAERVTLNKAEGAKVPVTSGCGKASSVSCATVSCLESSDFANFALFWAFLWLLALPGDFQMATQTGKCLIAQTPRRRWPRICKADSAMLA